ncbi:MAG: SGNH/GDSL hydrolase family protein [Pseudolabrys sp.]|nr:SGNH/GDSL hydrolase family protein [Pseudolabrys sp.]
MGRLGFLPALPVLALFGLMMPGQTSPAWAGHPAECYAADHQSEIEFPLPHVARAIAAKRLTFLVVGAGSSSLPGPNGAQNAYPARLQAALAAKLPGVEVKVETNVKSRRRAADMVKTMAKSLASAKPALLIWQTATVDAMQGVDPEQFSQSLDKGIDMARSAGADVIFVNPQYSPRTSSMIAVSTYAENLRWVALQQGAPVFDRYNIMRSWAVLGTFDLYSATKKLDMAERVHDCLGLLLADLIIAAAKPAAP